MDRSLLSGRLPGTGCRPRQPAALHAALCSGFGQGRAQSPEEGIGLVAGGVVGARWVQRDDCACMAVSSPSAAR